ncbi:uncharacterized protein Bfra_005035 [Botrytis fragariae]|uniref:Uncharacterized protein n=1 Tax=Botrytis fragariae TaxID=1964551 RepID=A0A8H6EIK3_9HELO|nr:uncharacterized protein Bfra_005035 [Botrytis fragariae]KAF5873572.1 hypothetical protein Bfra_005035 [Botrytis fragariae]
MDSGDIDRAPLDDGMFPNDEAPRDSRICDNDRLNERGRSIAKECEDLEVQKAEFKKLQEDHRRRVYEFEEAKVEFEDKVLVHKTQVHQIVTNASGKLRTFHKTELENDRKLELLRAEQYKFNTAVKEFNKRLEKTREATTRFNEKSETLRGKLMAAKRREKSFLREYKSKQRYLVEREQRLDAKLKSLGIEEKFLDPDRETYEYLPSVLSERQEEREELRDSIKAENEASVSREG